MYTAIVFLPLLGSLIAGLFGRFIGARASEVVTTGFLLTSAALSIYAFFDVGIAGNATKVPLFTWINAGDFEVVWSLRIDTLTAVMLVVVTSVSALVHLYSIGYMSHDPHRPRFFSYLSLFTFAMLMLVTSDNFMQMFFGWEGVGLASYLLIGFWYKKPSANAAAIKAFVVNRVGDFGFALGIMAIFLVFGTVDFDAVFHASEAEAGKTFEFLGYQLDIMTTICLLLFMGAMGKSAQFFLHTWLPDAMEGPTPVSALIHAATMVTAGVFLVCRASPMFEQAPFALEVVTVIGATTAFFAATVGLFQNDIKRVIAYSTCSQLGYMFFAAGVSAYGVAMFHLFTHAFFKALLFLCAGSVIHAMSDEQDMRHMGGLAMKIPLTTIAMFIGTLSITGVGIPGIAWLGFAGFVSKDAVIEYAYLAHTDVGMYAFVIGLVAAAMTSFYSWRLMFMTFFGKTRASNKVFDHVHESPAVMLIPLALLSMGAIFAGTFFYSLFIGDQKQTFWNDSIYVSGAHGPVEAGSGAHGAAPHDDSHADDHAAPADEAHGTADTHGAADDTHGAAHDDAHGDSHGGHHVPTWVLWSPFIAMLTGLGIAWYFYIQNPELPAKLAARRNPIYLFFYNKWYFDELYDFIFVRPARWLGRVFWKQGDGWFIDGFGPNGVAARVLDTSRIAVLLQSGYVYHYAFAMLIGVALLISYFTFGFEGLTP